MKNALFNHCDYGISLYFCCSFLSCFAAGVFLGTCLLDLFPEVREKMNAGVQLYISKDNRFIDYPFAECVMVCGFFLVLIVEQVVLSYKESGDDYELLDTPTPRTPSKPGPSRVTYGSIDNSTDETDRLLEDSYNGGVRTRSRSASISSSRSINAISDRPVGVEDLGQSVHQDPNSHSPIRSFIMLAALSLHSVFEGLAVGLQDTVTDVVSIFGALILHKCIIAFSIGLNLVQSKISLRAIIASNFAFCFASPLGIAIGILINQYSSLSSGTLVNGILQGLACGTFLYVTFFEVLPHEFNKPADRILKLVFVLLGFAFVNGVVLLEEDLTYKPPTGN